MAEDTHIHFGHFVRWKHFEMGMSVGEFADKVGRTGRWLIGVERKIDVAEKLPDVAIGKLASALEMTSAALKEASRTTPVPFARFKSSGRSTMKITGVESGTDVAGKKRAAKGTKK